MALPPGRFVRGALVRGLGLWLGLRGVLVAAFLFSGSPPAQSLHLVGRASLVLLAATTVLVLREYRKPAERVFWANAGVSDLQVLLFALLPPFIGEVLLRFA